VDAMPSTPAEFSTLIHSEVPKWAASVKRAGVRAD